MHDSSERNPFRLSTSDVVALAVVTAGIVVVTILLVWILF